jgi:hypothetical protein
MSYNMGKEGMVLKTKDYGNISTRNYSGYEGLLKGEIVDDLYIQSNGFAQKRCKQFAIVLILILFGLIAHAQDRNDIIKLKSGAEIQCQILQIYEADSIIQFCIKEDGELKVKRIYTSQVDHYNWPGIDQADKYCRMLGVTNKSDGELYGAIPNIPVKPELTSAELAAKELNKAQTLFHFGIATTTLGLMTAIAGPNLLKAPDQIFNPFISDDELKTYDNKVKAIRIVGGGIMFAGVVMEFASINHYKNAKLLRQESLKGISLSTSRDGLCLAFKF